MADSSRREWLITLGGGLLAAPAATGQQPEKTPEEMKFETQLKRIAAEVAGGKALEHIEDKGMLNEAIAHTVTHLEKRAAAGETIPNGPEWKYLRVSTPGKDHKEAISIVIDPVQRTMAAYRGARAEKDGTIKISMDDRAGAYVDTRKIAFDIQDSAVKGTIYGNAEHGVRELNAIQAENYKREQEKKPAAPKTAVERENQRQEAGKKGGVQRP